MGWGKESKAVLFPWPQHMGASCRPAGRPNRLLSKCQTESSISPEWAPSDEAHLALTGSTITQFNPSPKARWEKSQERTSQGDAGCGSHGQSGQSPEQWLSALYHSHLVWRPSGLTQMKAEVSDWPLTGDLGPPCLGPPPSPGWHQAKTLPQGPQELHSTVWNLRGKNSPLWVSRTVTCSWWGGREHRAVATSSRVAHLRQRDSCMALTVPCHKGVGSLPGQRTHWGEGAQEIRPLWGHAGCVTRGTLGS